MCFIFVSLVLYPHSIDRCSAVVALVEDKQQGFKGFSMCSHMYVCV